MIQAIITYIIIGVAITAAFYKLRAKFGKKKKTSERSANLISSQNKCTDCLSDCTLKDSLNSVYNSDTTFCKKLEANQA